MKRFLSQHLFVFLTFFAATSFLFSACQKTPPSSTNTPTSSNNSSTQNQTSLTAIMQNVVFEPKTIQAKVGQSVTWTNKDSFAHTVTSDNGAFDSGNVSQNGTFSFTFTKAGTYSYHCSIHPSMTGQVVVTD